MFNFLYKSSFTFQILAIFICGLLMWIPGFINPVLITHSNSLTPLYNVIIDIINILPFLPVIFGLLCLFFIAFYFNNTLSANDIISSNNFLPAFMVVVLASWHNDLLIFHHALPAALCLVFAMRNSLKVATYEESYNNAFLIGFNIALASMFYFPAIIFIILIPIGFIVIKVFRLRFWLLAFSGFLFIYTCLAVWKFWFNILGSSISDYLNYFKYLSIVKFQFNQSIFFYLLGIPFLLLILISFLKIISSLIEHNIAIRQALLWLVWFGFIATIGFFIDSKDFIKHTVIIALPVSFFLIKLLKSFKRNLFTEIVFVLILTFVLFFRFYV